WSGYSEPMDVLRPFGYAPAFVARILDQAKTTTILDVDARGIEQKPSLGTFSTTSSLSAREYSGGLPIYPPFHTVAVRGAIYARPEGYCLCWDQDTDTNYYLSERSGDSKAMVRQEEMEAIRRKRNRRRRELQREVLPVVLWSKRGRNLKAITDANEPPETDGTDCVSPAGILQPCIQFLNVDSSHAVRLFTPPFANGPVSTPLTIFVIAIATEDGCFFSGHRKKFEMGHLYPANTEESLTERSPISLCADYQGPFTRIFDTVTTSDSQGSSKSQAEKGTGCMHVKCEQSTSVLSETEEQNGGNGHFNSDDSSCDGTFFGVDNGTPGWKCLCPLTGLGDLGSDVEGGSSIVDADDDDEDSGHVCRGRLGPGAWHCYMAVFDGENSVIRVDGVEEPVLSDTPIPPSFKACLDGLTIGSDHTFDMSLCFGQGSDGEGEGAMAELAVFKGRLDERDIEAVETHLMSKHGIDHPNRPQHEIVREDDCMRMAHSLLAQPWERSNSYDLPVHSRGVPLRYVAKLRQVAWKQINPVTGEAMVVQRIGSKAANDSSDW
ncbi:MAG: hypothetical protein SGILL_006472, partial [Bacillariaceae sp.]